MQVTKKIPLSSIVQKTRGYQTDMGTPEIKGKIKKKFTEIG